MYPGGEDGDQAFETPGGYYVSYGAGMTVSYDSAEAWEGGTTPVPPAGPPAVAQGPGPTGLAPPPGTPDRPEGSQPPGEQPPGGQPASGPPTIPVAQVPRDGEEPKDTAPPEAPHEQDTPQPSGPVLTVKATQTVLTGGASRTIAVPEAMIKLNVGPAPELPLAGNPKDDTGYADSPLQGLTNEDGTVAFTLPQTPTGAVPVAYTPGQQVAVDLTPQQSTLVHLAVEPDKANATAPATYLHPGLVPYVTRSWLLNGTLIAVLHYPQARTAAVTELLALSANVTHQEENYCRGKQAGPHDPYFHSQGAWGQRYADQWAIQRIGLTADRASAWQLLDPQKAQPVVVAVIDTGLDWNHQDIAWDNIWVNTDEIPDNGIDDDKNGYVDDIIGWDFFHQGNKPWDRDGHGTFVAGVIAATQDNGVGIAGINPHAKIMVLKALNNFGHTRASYLAEAILYAANNGARVINLSVGGKKLTRTEQIAVEYAQAKGVVIVVAAGNEGINVQEFGPAGLPHVITVASTDLHDKRAIFSNWGSGIDLAAPGMDVLSLRARRTDLMRDIPGVKYTAGQAYVGQDKRYYRASGTSFSAPIVAGAASLLLSRDPELTNDQVKRMILQSAKDIEVPGTDQHTGYGLLDVRAALAADPAFFIEARLTRVQPAQEGGQTVVRVSGTADANAFAKAWIEVGPGKHPTKWKQVSRTLTRPVKGGTLDDLAAGHFRGAKQWVLRLIVEHENGKRREARFQLKLQ
ncbi:MAG: S8 family serine peptidase [Candidatus Methylomirabilales bacterium]